MSSLFLFFFFKGIELLKKRDEPHNLRSKHKQIQKPNKRKKNHTTQSKRSPRRRDLLDSLNRSPKPLRTTNNNLKLNSKTKYLRMAQSSTMDNIFHLCQTLIIIAHQVIFQTIHLS